MWKPLDESDHKIDLLTLYLVTLDGLGITFNSTMFL